MRNVSLLNRNSQNLKLFAQLLHYKKSVISCNKFVSPPCGFIIINRHQYSRVLNLKVFINKLDLLISSLISNQDPRSFYKIIREVSAGVFRYNVQFYSFDILFLLQKKLLTIFEGGPFIFLHFYYNHNAFVKLSLFAPVTNAVIKNLSNVLLLNTCFFKPICFILNILYYKQYKDANH